jgi:putative isomerase
MPDYDAWLTSLKPTLNERDFLLLERAARTLTANILDPEVEGKLPWAPFRGIMPSPGTYRGVWNWDAAFHAAGVSHWDLKLAQEQIKILLEGQLPSGALPDVIFEDGRIVTDFGKPPVMPWAAAWIDQTRLDDEFLAYVYPKFKAYEQHWRKDRAANGMFHYDSLGGDESKRDENARLESGWDNSVRWDKGARRLWAVDLNCYMVMLYRALAFFAWRLGNTADKGLWEAYAEKLAERINEALYDPQQQAYLDRDFESGQFSTVFSPASFMPLYLQIASQERIETMAAHALNPAKFYPGMPTVAYDDPKYESGGYWRGPTWLNIAYFALKGLKDCGYREQAEAMRQNLLDWCAANPDHLYEYYDSRNGQGLGARQFGWTAAFVILFILDWGH